MLAQHPQVREAVIIVQEDKSGDKRLVAYTVPNIEPAPTANELRSFLKKDLPEYMLPTSFVTLDALPLTRNGKIDRRALPAPDTSRSTLETSFVAPCTPTESILAGIWAEILGREQIGIHDNFFELGGDSILSIQIVARANQIGLVLTPQQLFQHQTIAELATVAGTTKTAQAQQGLVTGSVPLTPIQQWFVEQNLPDPHHFNQSVLLSTPADLKPERVEQVVRQLLVHHDALRLQLMPKAADWVQVNRGLGETVPLSLIDLSRLTPEEQQSALEAAAAELQTSLSLEDGCLIQVAQFQLGSAQPGRLLFTIHHWAVDAVSWRILLEDFATLYQQLSQGEAMQLLPKSTAFQDWAQRLGEYGQSQELAAELDYWLMQSRTNVKPLPVDYPSGRAENTIASAAKVSVALSVEQTRVLLQEMPSVYKTQINDVLLTALVQTFAQWTGERCLLVELEGHGREQLFADVDLSRTVGWFTAVFPVLLQLEEGENPGLALKTVEEQLRQVPNRGIGYGLLRYLTQDSTIPLKLQALAKAEVLFNYLGQFDQVLPETSSFRLAKESTGSTCSPLQRRGHLLEIDGFVVEGMLHLEWIYSENVHQRVTVERLAQAFIEQLTSALAHCQSKEAKVYTPSDFPLANITQQTLDRLLGHGRQIEQLYPLSPMQQGILFDCLYAPNSEAYFEQFSCIIDSKLNVSAFRQAWERVLEHAALRTAFFWQELEQPLQVVQLQVELPWFEHDWQGLSPEEQQQKFFSFQQADRQQGFTFDRAPLMRCALIQVDKDVYYFVWSFHHLVLDGWSVPLVLKEVFAFYEAFCQGENLSLSAPRPFWDYIAWLQQQDFSQAETFWKENIKGFTAPTPLAYSQTVDSNSSQNHTYAEQHLQLSAILTASLKSLAQKHHLTVNTLVQGVWGLLLSRYSGEQDVVFGTTVSGRPPVLLGVESMVGMLINTLPVRVQVSEETALFPWLQQLQQVQVEREQYAYSPLREIHHMSDVPQGLPLFESIVSFENYPIDPSLKGQIGSLRLRNIDVFDRTGYPLTVDAAVGSELLLKITYDERFDEGTIARMIRHLQTLFEGIVANPEERISELSLLDATEKHQLLVEWNDTQAEYPQEKCFHQLFEAQVNQQPDAVAVVHEDQQLTYRDLNARANSLARVLVEQGVGVETIVALLAERSIDFLTTIIAIFKAGGAYLPLDLDHPAQRQTQVLTRSHTTLVLVAKQFKPMLSAALETASLAQTPKLLVLEELLQQQRLQENLAVQCQPKNLAYVIYTSGSTGVPKGAMLEHKGMLNHLYAKVWDLKLTEKDTVAQTSRQCFDISVWQFFSALLVGGRVHIYNDEIALDPAQLLEQVVLEQITILEIVPSLLGMMLEAFELQTLKCPPLAQLRWLIVTGEALAPKLCRQWLHYYASIPMLNAYGPTECSDDVSHYPVYQPPLAFALNIMPVGRPLANTQLYVLNPQLQPVPVGVAGELYVGGIGVGRGYLNQPELTAQKFIPDPFSNQPGTRLYKTGDLVRYLSDGNIDFLSRIDFQVKIRGFRIELGEIEAVLLEHPEVQTTVVIADEVQPGHKQLVAYVVPHRRSEPAIADLRNFLKQKLPEYMIPSAFVILESLPLTPNGKIDRHALPTPEYNTQSKENFVPPSTATEQVLVKIWSEVLRQEKVGIYDNFFELGGDSILSLQIVARANQAGLVITPRQLFQHQTIASLALVAGTTKAIPAQQGVVTGSVPLTPIQHWFLQQNQLEAHHFNLSVLLKVVENLRPEIVEQVIQQLLVHHDALRLQFVCSDSDWQQINLDVGQTVPFTVVDLSSVAPTEQQAVLEACATKLQASLSLSEGQLLRVALFQLGNNQPGRLLFIVHHLVMDGLSLRILLEDFANLYQQLLQGETKQLPPKTTAFQDWAHQLLEYGQSQVLAAELDYWLNPSRSDVPPLPVDYATDEFANTVATEATVSVVLSEEQTLALLQEVPSAYNTQIDDVLLTALVQAFAQWTGQSSLLVNLEAHGREELFPDMDLSRTVGWFTSLFPVQLELAELTEPGKNLKSVKEQLRQVPKRGIGYGLLRYLSSDEVTRLQLQALPQAQVCFNYLGQLDQMLSKAPVLGLAKESSGLVQSPQGHRSYLLEVESFIAQGKLRLEWIYSERVYQRSTIQRLAQGYITALQGLIAHCQSPQAFGYTPSDFPEAQELSQEKLDKLMTKITKAKR
jgi:amino acid adenylation domain-containing protein/non-ribosomal peptide synthase protein (TIGR01720 family)